MRKQLKHLKKEKGFTLVELLAVIVILGIIAAIAVPMIGNVINDSKDKAILADAQTILNAAKLKYSTDLNTTGTVIYRKDSNKTGELDQYVSGLSSNSSYKVELKSDGTWEITYSEFDNIKNSKYRDGLGEDDKLTEAQLKKLLSGE